MIALEHGVRVSGKVVDAQGCGIAGARVDLVSFAPTPLAFGRRVVLTTGTTARADGTFEVFPVRPLRDVELRASTNAYPIKRITSLDCREDVGDLIVTLSAGVAFAVSLTFPDGRPVNGKACEVAYRERGAPFFVSATEESGVHRFIGAAGVEYEVIAFAAAAAKHDEGFQGSTVVASTAVGQITLVPLALLTPRGHARSLWQVAFVDAHTGSSILDGLVGFRISGSVRILPLSSESQRFALVWSLASQQLRFEVADYEAVSIETFGGLAPVDQGAIPVEPVGSRAR